MSRLHDAKVLGQGSALMQDCLRPALDGDALYAGRVNGQLYAAKIR